MKIEILDYFLKKIGSFSMKDFNSRLAFQKEIYFLQRYGIGLGYDFDWFIHGPYSPKLASDGFKLNSIRPKKEIKIEFSDEEIEDDLQKFINFINKYKKNIHKLELLASIDFLMINGLSKNEVIEIVKRQCD